MLTRLTRRLGLMIERIALRSVSGGNSRRARARRLREAPAKDTRFLTERTSRTDAWTLEEVRSRSRITESLQQHPVCDRARQGGADLGVAALQITPPHTCSDRATMRCTSFRNVFEKTGSRYHLHVVPWSSCLRSAGRICAKTTKSLHQAERKRRQDAGDLC